MSVRNIEIERGEISFSVHLTSSVELVLRSIANRYDMSINKLIAHSISNLPVQIINADEPLHVRSKLEIIFSNSQSTFSQLLAIVNDDSNVIADERRRKIIALYKSLTELYKKRKAEVFSRKEIAQKATKNSFYLEKMHELKQLLVSDISPKRKKNFRVNRVAYQGFKNEKDASGGRRSDPLFYIYERLLLLNTLSYQYTEDTKLHELLIKPLKDFNDEFKSGAVKYALNSDNEMLVEAQFTKIYNKLVEIYKILKNTNEKLNDNDRRR